MRQPKYLHRLHRLSNYYFKNTMIDGNISMEEDTELRDLVVQTLENNGVLPKVRVSIVII